MKRTSGLLGFGFVLGTAAVVAALSLSGCSPSPQPEPPPMLSPVWQAKVSVQGYRTLYAVDTPDGRLYMVETTYGPHIAFAPPKLPEAK